MAFFFIGISNVSYGQPVCDDYYYSLNHHKKMTLGALDSLQVQLADYQYWHEWYTVLLNICRRKKENSSREVLNFLNSFNSDSINDLFVRGKFLRLKGYTQRQEGKIYEAILNIEKAYKLFRLINDEKHIRHCLKQIGVYYSLFNDHQSAIEYGHLYIDHLSMDDSVNLRSAYGNLSEYYYYAKQYEKALKHNAISHGYNKVNSPNPYLSEIKIRLELNDFIAVDSLISLTADRFREISWVRFSLNSYQADSWSMKGDYQKSIDQKRQLLNTGAENDDRETIKIRQSLAKDLFDNGQIQEALKETHQVQEFFSYGELNEDLVFVPDSSKLIPEAWLMESLLLKAQIFEEIWEVKDAKKILHTYEKAMFVLDLLRDNYKATQSIFEIGETDFSIFEKAIDYCWQQYTESNQEFYLEKALYYSQLAKSYTLKKSRSFREILEASPVPRKLSIKYLDFLISSQREVADKDKIYDSLDLYYQQILDYFPEFEELSSIRTIDLHNLQSRIDSPTAVLHYFVSADDIFSFVISKDHVEWNSTKKPDHLESLFTRYSQSLTDIQYINRNPKEAEEQYLSCSYEFYQLLFSSVEKFLEKEDITDLTIVPDDFMYEIPFESLKTKKDSSWTNSSNYLIGSYSIHYLFYLGEMLLDEYEEIRTVGKASIFGLDYYEYSDQSFIRLTNTLEECKMVNSVINGQFYSNKNVSQGQILSSISSDDIIHYSGHSIHNKSDFIHSYLPIYNNAGEASNLYYSDIVATICDAALVSLSACHTHDGQKERTEGLISVARAFKESGAQSCLGSLWSAADRSSKEILYNFYKHLSKGDNKAIALQNSLLGYLNNSNVKNRLKAPFYWSNWKLYGSPVAVEFGVKSQQPISYYILGFLLVLGIFLLAKKSLIKS